MQCPVCKGERYTVVLVDAPPSYHGPMRRKCPRCNGTGEVEDFEEVHEVPVKELSEAEQDQENRRAYFLKKIKSLLRWVLVLPMSILSSWALYLFISVSNRLVMLPLTAPGNPVFIYLFEAWQSSDPCA